MEALILKMVLTLPVQAHLLTDCYPYSIQIISGLDSLPLLTSSYLDFALLLLRHWQPL